MFRFPALVALMLLAVLRAASATSFKFEFKEAVKQCEPVSLKFKGNDGGDNNGDNNGDANNQQNTVPTVLTLLPLGGRPIQIPVPPEAANSSGIDITFLPLAANTMFLASLNDDQGDSASKISDVMMVMPSESGDSSCLTGQNPVREGPFTLPQSVFQCENFTVQYTTDVAPDIRMYMPQGGSYKVNMTDDSRDTKTANYTMQGTHGFPVVLTASTSDKLEDAWVSNLTTSAS
jgi:hypothetical protein